MKITTLLFCLFSFISSNILAQSDCNNYLDVAKNLYNKGQFEESLSTLKSCSSNEQDKIKQWQSSRLLAQSYLGLHDLKMATSAAEDMLQINPLYKPSLIEDNREFVNLIKSVTIVPRFSLSLSAAAGINISYPNVITSYGITDDGKTYKNGKAKQFGLYAGYSYSKLLSAHTGIIYAENNYALSYSIKDQNIKYQETLNYLQIPLFVRFQIKPKGNFKVFAQTGGLVGFLTKAKYDIENTVVTPDYQYTVNLKSMDMASSRTKSIYGALLGVGASYKFREGHVFGEINSQYSFTNINKENTRLNNDNLVYNYFFIDDDLRLNNLTFSLGYTFYLNYFVQRSK